ncbi:MAG: hypothetical protein APR63_08635 [Desulfuromonas sp. SDB]|nr:MAG: hypothetical protein APR63_08635 [Desulfuromonas sp. SDB]
MKNISSNSKIKFNYSLNRSFMICTVITATLMFNFNLLYSSNLLVDVESGLVNLGYCDVQVPADGGTFFSLTDDFSADNQLFYRIMVIYELNSRHKFYALIAPLSIKASGSFDDSLIFEKKTFPPQTDIDAWYRFNSYRLSYRYDFYQTPRILFGLGVTAKIRDAQIRLKSDSLESVKDNLGFVPLIAFKFSYYFNPQWSFSIEGDALAAPQGRAEDISASLSWELNPRFTIRGGYRLLEGGADVEEVYNFTLLNYGILGFRLKI